jgi:trehalose 6-phosphate synthase
MPRTERISRYNDMMTVLRQHDISHWRESFLRDLNSLPQRGADHSTAHKVATFPKLA